MISKVWLGCIGISSSIENDSSNTLFSACWSFAISFNELKSVSQNYKGLSNLHADRARDHTKTLTENVQKLHKISFPFGVPLKRHFRKIIRLSNSWQRRCSRWLAWSPPVKSTRVSKGFPLSSILLLSNFISMDFSSFSDFSYNKMQRQAARELEKRNLRRKGERDNNVEACYSLCYSPTNFLKCL